MKRRNLISDINVVPYIDVMLVLLVIFMISAPLMVQGIQVNLPQASSEALPVTNNEPLIVSIDKNGELFLETDSTKDKSLSLEELTQEANRMIEDLENQKDLENSIESYQTLLKLNKIIEKKFQRDIRSVSENTNENILKIISKKNEKKIK